MVIQVGKTSVGIGLLSSDNDEEEEDRKSGKLVILSTSC